MAIKGKTRAKSKPKPVARAPKPVPVNVKPPFFLRRWVQVTLAIVAGVGSMVVLIWATNGVRDENRSKETARKRESARRVVQEWQTTVDAALVSFGPAGAGGGPPVLFPELSAAMDATSKGKPLEGLETIATDARDLAASTADDLDQVDLSTLIAGKGLVAKEAIWVLDSQKRMVLGLELYGEAATLMADVAGLPEEDQTRLARRAAALAELADEAFQDGYQNYTNALASVGLFAGATPPAG
ncbi:MAG TPA: hypothetical protein VGR41_06975 [Actinomycetota bacterium]|jgi:hypothetical protein|nr:hypothetical protein [Actinomycetota bacterium]